MTTNESNEADVETETLAALRGRTHSTLVYHLVIEWLRALSLSETLELTLRDIYEEVIFGDEWVVMRSTQRPVIVTRELFERTKKMVAAQPLETSAYTRSDELIFLQEDGQPVNAWDVQRALCSGLERLSGIECPAPAGTFRHFVTDGPLEADASLVPVTRRSVESVLIAAEELF